MSRKMLIDAAHPEETRVVVVESDRVEDFDFESATKKQIRGNIYLAKVTRVEPSLQAAFVEYGGNKHGFLAFNEIHPDYYQIPYADRMALREAEAALAEESAPDPDSEELSSHGADDEEIIEEAARKRRQLLRKYKIQEVIKRRQVLLVQVAKEERGNKGAALTTYLSLAGRYCVLMPNTARGGGISRKITNASDRKRLKESVNELKVPAGMGLIIRTAGASRTKAEIKRDYDYLLRLWETIRELTLKSTAPTLIYEEGNLVKRAIRDLYDKDIEQILVEGDEAYKEAKAFIRMLMPSHAKKVQHYREETPLFLRHQVESQLEAIYSPVAQLKSGGYLVINPTEALVSVDVNSGKSTKERNIEQTALRTNLEAAEEAARQMRLRDLAGLLVIDFIDMEENKNVRAVEKKMKDVLKKDRARIQMGRISQFGLLEMSRQRRRTSLMEGSTQPCPYCDGSGHIRSVESSALVALRTLEEEGVRGRTAHARLTAPEEVALYLLNEKRDHLRAIEERFHMRVSVTADASMMRPHCELERVESRKEAARAEAEAASEAALVTEVEVETETAGVETAVETAPETGPETGEEETRREGGRDRRRGGRRRKSRSEKPETAEAEAKEAEAEAATEEEGESAAAAGEQPSEGEAKPSKRRRRGRRGGRGRRRRTSETRAEGGEDAASADDGGKAGGDKAAEPAPAGEKADAPAEKAETSDVLNVVEPEGGEDLVSTEAPPKRERPSRKKKKADDDAAKVEAEPAPAETTSETAPESESEKPAPKRKPRKSASRKKTEAEVEAKPEAAPAPAQDKADSDQGDNESEESGPRKKGWWQRSSKFLGLG
ncbi:ribonuclease E/G [Marinicauda salina]|uniref:Ribonuclease E n=1 Tax=Marinicauda salina TaxID=2135793 RepID=A0A2U2BTI7_9PROT|nr:ribonuclease E/G [Marinicauda salina]PWE17310.1 ribonuclease E/G [Marinicauda salina]